MKCVIIAMIVTCTGTPIKVSPADAVRMMPPPPPIPVRAEIITAEDVARWRYIPPVRDITVPLPPLPPKPPMDKIIAYDANGCCSIYPTEFTIRRVK